MSEEKPTFKVVDRRLFNPDGSARELTEEEERERAMAAAAARATSTDASSVSRDRPRAEPEKTETPGAGRETSTAGEDQPQPRETEQGEDPQSFMMLVEFVASFAADALGMVDHPGEGRGNVNLPLARQCIDMLVTLKSKTRNNLSAEEQQILDVILSQLRMQYVKTVEAGRARQPARGFSGSDITGGK
jgi:hypothetical protein